MYDGFPDLNLQLSGTSYLQGHPLLVQGRNLLRRNAPRLRLQGRPAGPRHLRAGACPGRFGGLLRFQREVPPPPASSGSSPAAVGKIGPITSFHDQLVRKADLLIRCNGGRKQITAGLLLAVYRSSPRDSVVACGAHALWQKRPQGVRGDSRRPHRPQPGAPLPQNHAGRVAPLSGRHPPAVYRLYGA